MRINGASFFKQSFELKIKGDLIPEAAAEEIIGELQALFARHNAGAALSAKAVFKPTKEFHAARHRINFKFGMLNFEFLQFSDFQFQLFHRGAGGCECEDEAEPKFLMVSPEGA